MEGGPERGDEDREGGWFFWKREGGHGKKWGRGKEGPSLADILNLKIEGRGGGGTGKKRFEGGRGTVSETDREGGEWRRPSWIVSRIGQAKVVGWDSFPLPSPPTSPIFEGENRLDLAFL